MADPIIFPVPNPENPKERNSVWFEWLEDKDEMASAEAGHPVFDTILLAHIMAPGNQRSEAVRVVERKKPDGTVKTDARELGSQIEAFKKDDLASVTGTPLDELTMLDRGLKATLKALGVHDLEGLAAMSETAAPQFLGFRKYKTAAQALLDQRAGQAPLAKMAADLEKSEEQRALLQRTVDDLAREVRELQAERTGKRKAA